MPAFEQNRSIWPCAARVESTRRLNGGRVAHVHRGRGAADLGRDLRRRVSIAIGDHDVRRAVGGESPGQRRADATTAAGDDDDPAVDVHEDGPNAARVAIS